MGIEYSEKKEEGMRVKATTEDANIRQCSGCLQWDNPENLYVYKRWAYHRECANAYMRERCGRYQ